MMSSLILPKARHDDLITTKVGDETVIYDIYASKAYCLNRLTTLVWNACNGHNRIESLLNQVKQSGLPDVTEDLIREAMLELFEANLLIGTSDHTEKDYRFTRRDALRLMGKGTIASLPLLTAIEIQPALAQSSAACSTTTNCDQPCNNGKARCYDGTGCGCDKTNEQCDAVGGIICVPGTI